MKVITEQWYGPTFKFLNKQNKKNKKLPTQKHMPEIPSTELVCITSYGIPILCNSALNIVPHMANFCVHIL
jgi:hypothetical protein